jgi:hypothetical protein
MEYETQFVSDKKLKFKKWVELKKSERWSAYDQIISVIDKFNY